MSTGRTLRGRAAVVGLAETTYYKWGQAPDPEFKLALQAVLAACEDAGIPPTEIDGFSSYSNDRSDALRRAWRKPGSSRLLGSRSTARCS